VALRLRDGRADDADRVRAFTADTWPERDEDDYVGDVYPRWVDEATDSADRRVLVAERGGAVVGVMRGCLLSPDEGWAGGLRVAHEARGEGVGARLTRATLDWLRETGATVCRNIVHAWNAPSLALSRAAGFAPLTAFRFVEPTPDPDAGDGPAPAGDPRAAWAFWSASETNEALSGLALDPTEGWALSAPTRERFRAAADEDRLLVVGDGRRVDGLSVRTRVTTDGDERIAEYGVGAWRPGDAGAATTLLAAVSRDAAAAGADRTRVVVPERVPWVSDAASAGAGVADDAEFVLAAALDGESQAT